MPYIKQDRRKEFDKSIGEIVNSINPESRAGELNYIITTLLVRSGRGPANYKMHNENMGVLDAASREYYRRVVAPYEDEAIKKNGDITVYGR